MGLIPGFLKKWAIRREVEALGKKLSEEKNPVLEFLKRNKLVTGLLVWAVTAATAWAGKGCAPAYDFDVLAALHVSCGTCTFVLGMIGTFLVGGGIMTSDKHEKVIQGLKAPEGPPDPKPEDVKAAEDAKKG